MKIAALLIVACLCPVAVSAKDTLDPRLALVRAVWIAPGDALADDQAVVACAIDHLARLTPLTLAASHADADATLTITATIRTMQTAGDGLKFYFTRHNGTITAALPGAPAAWSAHVVTGRLRSNVACVLADQMLTAVRKSMQKARDRSGPTRSAVSGPGPALR